MSTHYIEEAQRLADTVLIMSHGSAVAAGAPAELVAEHAGREAVEVYGSPAMLAEAEASARAAGFATRRTGTSISVLGIEDADGRAPDGERRPANLEDVFVLLTGERSSDGDPGGRAALDDRQARAAGHHRRARPRDRQLLLVLALGELLLDGRADHLPARVRLRLRLAP